jgi:hypothetical protein
MAADNRFPLDSARKSVLPKEPAWGQSDRGSDLSRSRRHEIQRKDCNGENSRQKARNCDFPAHEPPRQNG